LNLKETLWRRRLAGMAVTMTVLMLTGCMPEPDIDSSNRGSGTDTETTSVENAYIVPQYKGQSCAIQVGASAQLSFTATNNKSGESERLTGISTPAADDVRIAPTSTVEIPPRSSIAAGQPVENLRDAEAPDRPFTVTLEGTNDRIQPGTSVEVTFLFDRFGELKLNVPIEACPRQQQ
jgi:copper(I)-binding protein